MIGPSVSLNNHSGVTVTGLSTDVWDRLKQSTQHTNSVVALDSDFGTIVNHGVTCAYVYNSATCTLTINVTSHPFVVPLSTVRDWLAGALRENLRKFYPISTVIG